MRLPVSGFEGLYEVDENGTIFSLRSNQSLKPIKMESGYLYVHLCDGKATKLKRIHRIVAEAFIANPKGYAQVNHKNGNKCDNRALNLEWCNAFHNMRHAMEMGLFNPTGESNPSSKLTKDIVECIRMEYRRGSREKGTAGLAKKYGVSNVMISKIVRGENWKT